MTDLYAEALKTFEALLNEARLAGDPEPTAMTLATATVEGQPSARTVLLKEFDARGFVFYTNLESRKSHELGVNPQVALLFHWKTLRNGVQVKITGSVSPVSAVDADTYFASRPRLSQIGAWASLQSQPLDSRQTFEMRIAQFDKKFEGVAVPRPPHWSGFCVAPDTIEFWYGADFRLHERHYYERNYEEGSGETWNKRMLYP